ncbi:MAG: sulfatase, partial [Acidobacteriota bacterium]
MIEPDSPIPGESIRNRRLRWMCSRVALSSLVCILLSACAPDSPDNFVLISLDTVRRDHLSAYGYERPTSPFLDSLADDGVLFLDAFAQATNTAPSHASMFTGLYPQTHGLLRNGYPLPAEGPLTMAELLRSHGFRTGAFISGYTLESDISGLNRGFEIYDDEFGDTSRDGSSTLERALAWLAGLGPEERFFLFFHVFDVHGPYVPPAEVDGLFESSEPGPKLPRIAKYQKQVSESGERIANENFYVDRYDELVRYQDGLVERLLQTIDLTDTVVLITADHGETLG